MSSFKKILVAFDGSESSKNALKEACHLSKEEKAIIVLLVVVPPYEGDLDLLAISDVKEKLETLGNKLLDEGEQIAKNENVTIQKVLEYGEPYEEIVSVAEKENCDLIIMGRKGLGGVEIELVGSVTARVIGHTKKDVLVIPEGSKLSWNKILVASDNSPNSRPALEKAFEIAKEHSSSIAAVTVVYIDTDFFTISHKLIEEMKEQAKKHLEELKAEAASKGLDLALIVKEGEPHEGIINAAEEFGADLIVMGSHGRTGLKRLLMGSVTEKVLGFAVCPVLVCHVA